MVFMGGMGETPTTSFAGLFPLQKGESPGNEVGIHTDLKNMAVWKSGISKVLKNIYLENRFIQ
jgi:hypothetical protein